MSSEIEMIPPRESVIDLALLLEMSLQEEDTSCRSGEPVMDLHRLKRMLEGQEERLDHVLRRVHLQGVYLTIPPSQRRALRRETIALVRTCMHILDVCDLLDSEREL
ncbi:MAG: hypothetical protein GX307_06520 [Euryarchaeota archaeon]|nr:hypothetical protein [Euryarchaeota archaeon]